MTSPRSEIVSSLSEETLAVTHLSFQSVLIATLSCGILVSPKNIAWSQQTPGPTTVTLSSAGGDIGAQVNAAVASFGGGGGSIYIPAQSSCYVYTTPIVLADYVKLFGSS